MTRAYIENTISTMSYFEVISYLKNLAKIDIRSYREFFANGSHSGLKKIVEK